jgi:hypothetical protein
MDIVTWPPAPRAHHFSQEKLQPEARGGWRETHGHGMKMVHFRIVLGIIYNIYIYTHIYTYTWYPSSQIISAARVQRWAVWGSSRLTIPSDGSENDNGISALPETELPQPQPLDVQKRAGFTGEVLQRHNWEFVTRILTWRKRAKN